jgi:hypothetical protein
VNRQNKTVRPDAPISETYLNTSNIIILIFLFGYFIIINFNLFHCIKRYGGNSIKDDCPATGNEVVYGGSRRTD